MIKLSLLCLLMIKTANLLDISYYEILGITKQASTQEIRQAYKKLAIKLHPDKNSNKDEQDRFLKITEAYETLKDPDQRHKYDMYGSHASYTRKYDFRSQTEYNNLYYNGLYHNDPFVDTVSGGSFYNYLTEGLHFVNFYSPFCPPCQNLVDHWKKLAEIYKGIVKIAAVNCKYHNSFCYNSMRIGSYPSLLFYPNGKNGNYMYYRGGHNFDALDQFVMSHVSTKVNVPVLWQLRNVDKPMAYVVDTSSIDENALIRIAFRLKGLVSLVIVEDKDMRSKLTKNSDAVIVFRSKGIISKEIHNTDENDILKQIVEALPQLEQIDPDKFKRITMDLLNEASQSFALYFTAKDDDKLPLYQMRNAFPNINFGEVDCEAWRKMCEKLQISETPAWAVLKRGGAYQRAHAQEAAAFIRAAAATPNLHTLASADLAKILNGEDGTWVLLIVPYPAAWDHLVHPFTRASAHYVGDAINFGIMACTAESAERCRQVAREQPLVLVQNGTARHVYSEQLLERGLIDYIQLLRESGSIRLTEQDALEILDASSREYSWLVAYMPAGCGAFCDELEHEWRTIARRLRPLEFVRVGVLACARAAGLCLNVRVPAARLYPVAAGQHYTLNLQHVSQAPYILEWALEHIDDTVRKLTWHSFNREVFPEDLNSNRDSQPWLIYFHSPRCYRCYELYPDFAIISIMLGNSMKFGKVNCISERSLCQHERITSYPALKLYLSSHINVALQPKEYTSLLQDIKPHLMRHSERLLASIDNLVQMSRRTQFQHDEL